MIRALLFIWSRKKLRFTMAIKEVLHSGALEEGWRQREHKTLVVVYMGGSSTVNPGPDRSKFDERILKRKNLRSNCLYLIREKLLTEKEKPRVIFSTTKSSTKYCTVLYNQALKNAQRKSVLKSEER